MQPIQFGGLTVGGGAPLLLIAGPCVIESEAHAIDLALAIRDIARRAGVPYVFKASYDKANRTSGRSFRGPGLDEGLRILARVRERAGVPILTDIHEPAHAAPVAEVADVLQIPAFLSRQTDLLVAAARTGRVVNIKKGQFLAPADMRHAIEKVTAAGNARVIVTERGVTFGYHNLVVDMRAFPHAARARLPGRLRRHAQPAAARAPATASPPARRSSSSRWRRRASRPASTASSWKSTRGRRGAKSDAQNALRLDLLEPLLARLVRIHAIARRTARQAAAA